MGVSSLCHASFCNRYRFPARTLDTLVSSSGNCGFNSGTQNSAVHGYGALRMILNFLERGI